jgi:alpha-L-fucosidase 2
MKEAAEFLLDWLVPDPATGKLVSGPSFSPENSYIMDGKRLKIDMGPTMDQMIISELFNNCIKAAEVLDKQDDFVERIRKARPNLAGPKIGSDGRLLEWSAEYIEWDSGHRHLSHLYAVAPGRRISFYKTPELAEAARKSLILRNQYNTRQIGWYYAWNALLWARLGDGEKSYDMLKSLLCNSTYPNMMDNCDLGRTGEKVFMIDGNLGGITAIAEYFLQSDINQIDLLPALPESWKTGEVRGLRARTGSIIDIYWEDGKATSAKIHASVDGSFHVKANVPIVSVNDIKQTPSDMIALNLDAGETCVLKFSK